MTAQRGGTVWLDGARLSVPPGAVSRQAYVRASTEGAPPSPSRVRPAGLSGARISPAAAPVHFTVTGARLTSPVQVTFRVPPVTLPPGLSPAGRASAVWLAFYNTSLRQWQPVPSTYDPATHTVTAQVQHLSWWAPWTWNLGGLLTQLRYDLAALPSLRAPAASCPQVPSVTLTSTGGNDPPLIGCAVQAGAGALTVSITNNRGLSVVVNGVPPGAVPAPASYHGLDAYIATRGLTTRVLRGPDLPPGETLTYTLPLHGPLARFTAAPTLTSYALDLAVPAGEDLVGKAEYRKLNGDYGTCLLNTAARNAPATLSDVPDLAVSCLTALAESAVADTKYAKPLAGLLQHLGWAVFDIKALLQDYDLVRDTFGGVTGQVTIQRPILLPDFYYSSAVLPQKLYVPPAFPRELGIDNHDYITVQRVDAWDADSMTMTGLLHYDKCQPDCAAGPEVSDPVQVVATIPDTCKVEIGPPGSGTYEQPYVFSKISVQALGSSPPPSYLTGDSVLRVCSP